MKGVRGGSALGALLAAGGLYAWRNRDKIQNWVNNQRGQMGQQQYTQPSGTGSYPVTDTTPSSTSSYPMTGETQRINESDLNTSTDSTEVQKDPFASGI